MNVTKDEYKKAFEDLKFMNDRLVKDHNALVADNKALRTELRQSKEENERLKVEINKRIYNYQLNSDLHSNPHFIKQEEMKRDTLIELRDAVFPQSSESEKGDAQ